MISPDFLLLRIGRLHLYFTIDLRNLNIPIYSRQGNRSIVPVNKWWDEGTVPASQNGISLSCQRQMRRGSSIRRKIRLNLVLLVVCCCLVNNKAISMGTINPTVTPSKFATASKNSVLLSTMFNCRYSSKMPSNTKYNHIVRRLFNKYERSIIKRITTPIKSEMKKKSKKCPTLSAPKTSS